jgi:hypothetical protein
MITAQWIHFAGMTLGLVVDGRTGRIVDAPEIVSDFVGRPFFELLKCIETMGLVDGEGDQRSSRF